MKIVSVAGAVFLLWCSSVCAQNFNRPVHPGLFPYEFVQMDSFPEGYFLSSLFSYERTAKDPRYIIPYLVVFDPSGFVCWYAKYSVAACQDFKYNPHHRVYSFSTKIDDKVSFVLLDSVFSHLDTLHPIGNHIGDVHDFLLLDNGNKLMPLTTYDTMDLSSFTFDSKKGSATTVLRGFGLQEINAEGEVVFEWNSNNHIPPTECYADYGYNPEDFDYCHGNAVEKDDDGNYLLSLRNLNAIYKIDKSTGAVLWRLGGKSSDFSFINDVGFSAQHDIRKLPNGNYTLFDNARMSNSPQKSRGVEYRLDTVMWTATKVSEYFYVAPFYSKAMGNFQTAGSNHKLLGGGVNFRPNPSAILTDSSYRELAEFCFKDSVMSYRTFFFDLPDLRRPTIECEKDGFGYNLFAPAGMKKYLWSTGDTTQSIYVHNIDDAIQVWIPHGIGFIGSTPFYTTSGCRVANSANYSGIKSIAPSPGITGTVVTLDFGYDSYEATISVCSALGQEVIQKKRENERHTEIDVEALPAGCYIVRIFNSQICTSLKVIKQ